MAEAERGDAITRVPLERRTPARPHDVCAVIAYRSLGGLNDGAGARALSLGGG
ncbi:MAG: hypothetical protein H0T68_09170 [Gemmatimonadales bacterium]|nr:hypothetical protein [Gemmatimonadales bacterium]